MTERQILLIKNSWSYIVPDAEGAGVLFYQQLFTIAPELRHLFKQDLQSQAKKLISMLTYIVSNLQTLDDILEDVKALAVRHIEYGTTQEHYFWVGVALLRTIKQALGENWNQETEEAWQKAYNTLTEVMIAQMKNGGAIQN